MTSCQTLMMMKDKVGWWWGVARASSQAPFPVSTLDCERNHMLEPTKEDLQELGQRSQHVRFTNNQGFERNSSLVPRRKAEMAFLEKIGQKLVTISRSSWQGRDLSLCGWYLGSLLAECMMNATGISIHCDDGYRSSSSDPIWKEVRRFYLARSGNSPESVATVQLFKTWSLSSIRSPLPVPKEGKLALQAHGDERNLASLNLKKPMMSALRWPLLYLHALDSSLGLWSKQEEIRKNESRKELVHLSEQILEKDRAAIQRNWSILDFERVVYLGQDLSLVTAHLNQLDLELTAGKIATMYESVGFKMRSKILINDQTIVLVFGSIDPYTRQYDLDLVLPKFAGIRLPVRSSWQLQGIEHVREMLVDASADS